MEFQDHPKVMRRFIADLGGLFSGSPVGSRSARCWAVSRLLLIAGPLLVLMSPSAAIAQGFPHMYSHPAGGPCSSTDTAVDPVTVVFVGAPSWPSLDEHFGHHLFWGSVDSGGSQSIQDTNFACRDVARQRATDDEGSSDRLHARIFEYGIGYESGVRTDWHLHVTPHHDIRLVSPSCHTIPEDGFTQPRDNVVSGFYSGYPFSGGHELLKWAYWGNDKMIEKCGGRRAGSDGWVAFLDAAGAFGSTS